MNSVDFCKLCAAINHACTYDLFLPREWILLQQEARSQFFRAHQLPLPLDSRWRFGDNAFHDTHGITYVNLKNVTQAERDFSAEAFEFMTQNPVEANSSFSSHLPWWDFFLKLQ